MFKMIAFDMDGTLTPSRSPMDPEMVGLFQKLLTKYKVGVISGGGYGQFQKQLTNWIGHNPDLLKNLYLCPTCSTKMYLYKENGFEEIYSLDLTTEEKDYIKNTLTNAIERLNLKPETIWGNTIDDRDTQISYVILGTEAPTTEKAKWDPDFQKRRKIIENIQDEFQDFDIFASGTTTIDITRKGVNKAYGVRKLMEYSGVALNDIIFVGDAVFPRGNDYPPLEIGVTTKRVFSVEDTKEYIRSLIG